MSDTKVLTPVSAIPEQDQLAIRHQLTRLLSDPLFRNSRRYPKLLQFLVEHALSGGPELKERTLGIDVFGRTPDYDTAVDPVVRIIAAEVRKRLAHYYSIPGREDEIRITLPAGSYGAEFHSPASKTRERTTGAERSLPAMLPDLAAPVGRKSRTKLIYASLFLAALAVGVAALAWWWARPAPVSALDAFWNPVLEKSESALLSVGQREEQKVNGIDIGTPPASEITLYQLYYLQSQNLALPDAIALARLGGLMQSKHFRYQVRGASQTNLSDLREYPVVLVGAFTNPWTMQLNRPLRFSFTRRDSLFMVRDRQAPERTDWSVDFNSLYLKVTIDYAIITRVIDPVSDRLIVAVGGLSGYGTQAASEFVTEPAYMRKLAAVAPRGWERKNIQIVISTRVINGSSGPPAIVSTVFW